MKEEKNNKFNSSIIKVTFFEPVNGKVDYFFGSLKAIYTVFTKEQIGCKVEALYAARLGAGKRKVTDYCTIEKRTVTRVAHAANDL